MSIRVQDISKHVNPSKIGSRKFSRIQYFLLMYIEESKNGIHLFTHFHFNSHVSFTKNCFQKCVIKFFFFQSGFQSILNLFSYLSRCFIIFQSSRMLFTPLHFHIQLALSFSFSWKLIYSDKKAVFHLIFCIMSENIKILKHWWKNTVSRHEKLFFKD